MCQWLGIPLDTLKIKKYDEWGDEYKVSELDHGHESAIGRGMITHFPEWTSPFWNMARNNDGTSKKIDVILGGMETIGSAERSTDKEQMRNTFHTISDGDNMLNYSTNYLVRKESRKNLKSSLSLISSLEVEVESVCNV